jgi:hypothetical protein
VRTHGTLKTRGTMAREGTPEVSGGKHCYHGVLRAFGTMLGQIFGYSRGYIITRARLPTARHGDTYNAREATEALTWVHNNARGYRGVVLLAGTL